MMVISGLDKARDDLDHSLRVSPHSSFKAQIMSKRNLQIPALNLEKAMATHSNTPAWKIPRVEEPGRLQSMGSRKSWTHTTEQLHFHFSLSCIG